MNMENLLEKEEIDRMLKMERKMWLVNENVSIFLFVRK